MSARVILKTMLENSINIKCISLVLRSEDFEQHNMEDIYESLKKRSHKHLEIEFVLSHYKFQFEDFVRLGDFNQTLKSIPQV